MARNLLTAGLLLLLFLFATSSLAAPSRHYRKAESYIAHLSGDFFYEIKVRPLCKACKKQANRYNAILNKTNNLTRLTNKYKKEYLDNARRVDQLKRRLSRSSPDKAKGIKQKIFWAEDENEHLANMISHNKRQYQKLMAERSNAMKALKSCEYKHCAKQYPVKLRKSCRQCRFEETNYNTVGKSVASIKNEMSNDAFKKAILQRDLDRLKYLDQQDRKKPIKERNRYTTRTRQEKTRELTKRINNLHAKAKANERRLRQEAKRLKNFKRALDNCERKKCPGKHSYIIPSTRGGGGLDTGYASTQGGFSAGLLGNYALNNRRASLVAPDNINNNEVAMGGSQKRVIDGFGFGLILQYALLAHPALFFYGMYTYPGDHDGTALDGSINSNLALRLQVIKRYSFAFGVAYTLLHYGNNQLSLGLGMDVVNQALRGAIYETNNEMANVDRNLTSLAPNLLVETLIPVHQRLSLMLGLSLSLLPSLQINTTTDTGPYLLKLHQGLEWTFLFGIKYSLFS